MNYLSLVTIAVREDDANDDLFKSIDPDIRISSLKGIRYMEYNWSQWYLDSPCDPILAVMSYLETLGRENYAFIRLGESTDDITYLGSTNEFGLAVDAKIVIIPYKHIMKDKPTGDINE